LSEFLKWLGITDEEEDCKLQDGRGHGFSIGVQIEMLKKKATIKLLIDKNTVSSSVIRFK
jgi:hypothetical protein